MWSTDRTLINSNSLGLSGPGHKANEEVLYIHKISRIRASPSDAD